MELAVVLALVGLLAVLLMTYRPGFRASPQFAARGLVEDLRAVRETAIRLNATQEVVFDDGTLRYRDAVLREVASGIRLTLSLPEGAARGSGPDTIAFFPDGSASAASVILDDDSSVETITIDWLSGRIRRSSAPIP